MNESVVKNDTIPVHYPHSSVIEIPCAVPTSNVDARSNNKQLNLVKWSHHESEQT